MLGRQHLCHPAAHGGAVDVGPVDPELVEDCDRVPGERARRPLGFVVGAAGVAGPAVVEGDDPELRIEEPTEVVPPDVGVGLALEQQERRRAGMTADLYCQVEDQITMSSPRTPPTKRAGPRLETSRLVMAPSVTCSATRRPTSGACITPWPEKPQAWIQPGAEGSGPISGFASGVFS